MNREKKQKIVLFSNFSFGVKLLVCALMLLMVLVTTALLVLHSTVSTWKDKYNQTEETAVNAAEQLMNMSIDSTVSIAKSIYTNEAIYRFLNMTYPSSAEYYEAYYPLQQNTAMNIADTNVVKRFTIYSANPTILTGGNIRTLDSAKDEYWYQTFKKMNKPTLLCIPPDGDTPLLIRKLDYMALETGESYICLEMNRAAMSKFVENLGFDGELYVMSGGTLLYSSEAGAGSVDDITIDPDFACITRNYYALDVEFYAHAREKNFLMFLSENRWYFVILTFLLLLMTCGILLVYVGVRKRVRPAIREFRETNLMSSLTKGANGSDEVGKLLDICCDMTGRLQRKGDEFEESSQNLEQKSSDYASLFRTAMRLDAELKMRSLFPELCAGVTEEEIPFMMEQDFLSAIVEHHGAKLLGTVSVPEQWRVPAYSIALAAEWVFAHQGGVSANVTAEDGIVRVSFLTTKAPRTTEVLKLRAIFEDSGISEAYSFERDAQYNAFLRLKHCMGDAVDADVSSKGSFGLTLKLMFLPQNGENA